MDPTAAPWSAPGDGRSTGILLCHGITGSPASLRSLAEDLAARGFPVDLPRLPGHGTHWRELAGTEWPDWYAAAERGFDRLADSCARVVVLGLSMGGALALRLAEREPVAGLALVNPAIAATNPAFRLLPALKHVVPSIPAIGNDIAKPGADEHAYPRTPLRAVHSMTKLWDDVRRGLDRIDCPVLLLTSTIDHVVDRSTRRILLAELGPLVTDIRLEHSYHVATLDHDAGLIADRTAEFAAALGSS